jgi:hypothetical protein
MKKFIFLILLLSNCGFLTAQYLNDENKRVFCGISFGPSVDWFSPSFKEITREKAKGGFIAGINMDINFTKIKLLYFSSGLYIRYLQGELSFLNQYDFSIITATDTSLILRTVRRYQTTYLTVPTGIKFRSEPIKGCIFLGKFGLYHNFKVGGEQFDNFDLPNADPKYFVSTEKVKNTDASLFAESGYVGLGFEYAFKQGARIFINIDYSCQFNYFSYKAKSNVMDKRFRTIVHSLHLVFGVLF